MGSKKDSKYKWALEEILEVWGARDCLHTCRWGYKTVEICTDALIPASPPKNSARKKNAAHSEQD